MRKHICLTVMAAAAILFLFVPQTMALDEVQEEEYQKARFLLMEGSTTEAKSIFTELLNEDPSNFKVRLGLIDITLEEARILKNGNNSAWKSKVYTAFGDLKNVYRVNTGSPEMYLSFAKCYSLNDRFQKATKSLKKAFYYRPNFTEGFIVKGDIYFERSKVVEVDPFDDSGGQPNSNAKNSAVKSYTKALSASTDTYMQAMVNYKLAYLYSYHGNRIKEKEQYNRIMELSPDSYWGQEAKMRLSKLK